jgi:hypothetical protein
MKTQPRSPKTGAPHLLVSLCGVLIPLILIAIALKTNFVPKLAIVIFAACWVAIFRWLSRRSAKAEHERRQQELERLRHTPVLHLND